MEKLQLNLLKMGSFYFILPPIFFFFFFFLFNFLPVPSFHHTCSFVCIFYGRRGHVPKPKQKHTSVRASRLIFPWICRNDCGILISQVFFIKSVKDLGDIFRFFFARSGSFLLFPNCVHEDRIFFCHYLQSSLIHFVHIYKEIRINGIYANFWMP